MGRPVLVMGDDVALACIVRCKGLANYSNCHVEDCPNVIVDRRGSSCMYACKLYPQASQKIWVFERAVCGSTIELASEPGLF